MVVSESRIRIAAKMMATDGDMLRMFGWTPEELERNRECIDRARTEAMVTLKYQRSRVQARKPAKSQQ